MGLEYNEAVVEVLDLLNHTELELVEKIPKKLIEFWKKNASNTYKSNIDYNKKIDEMNLKPKTKALIGMIYRNYWCTPEERKTYDEILVQNEKDFQDSAREKYNPDKIFEKPQEDFIVRNKFEDNTLSKEDYRESNIIEYKENIFLKILNKIKEILLKR